MNERKYSVRISSQAREIVAIDDFRIAKSAITILFGESGIGKSLISLAIAGLLDPDELDIKIDGKPYTEYLNSKEAITLKRNGFFVFQEPSSHLNPLMTLRTQLREGNLADITDEAPILKRLWQDSASTNIEDLLDVYPKPYRPSGGEKQRILAAMAFKKMAASAVRSQESVFIFDEPTGNLDNKLRDEFLDLLIGNFHSRITTIVLITHDYSMINRLVNTYPSISKHILYRELLLTRGTLHLRDFLPGEYLSWLKKRREIPHYAKHTEIILRLHPVVNVFGKTLTISRDENGAGLRPLSIRKGAVTYLKAPSGTGKTTIVKIIMGLIKAEKMSLEIGGDIYTENTERNIWARNIWGRQMTMVFQHADESLNQNSRVKDIFSGLPVDFPLNEKNIINSISELFGEEADMDFLNSKVKYLSGGQKQRLNLLRSLILQTDILILDEPLNGLDFGSVARVISMIETKLKSGIGVLIISHNEEVFDTMVASEDVYYLHSSDFK